ncbi:hypothetical protein M2299_000300 [Stenotrophomonas sp. 1278]|uniref:DUF2523 family protein n=1 Tax=Stenotrophomonas sp. 1278 TaxID=2940566 RepID=UPI0024760810|nr:DUF2523 family protein [Stenotrophomonas sp. 1278]MDH6329500.1 hypothetical protein [Stenotrophomonas sp. 1278]
MMVWTWILKGVVLLVGTLKDAAAGIFARILATFGLTTVTFNAILPNLKAFVTQWTGGLSPAANDLLGYLGVGTAMSMVLSALAVRMTWKVFIVPKAVADQLGSGS